MFRLQILRIVICSWGCLGSVLIVSAHSVESLVHKQSPLQRKLTLERLEQIALENNPTLRGSAARLAAAHGLRKQAGLYPNPIVGYQGMEIGNEGRTGQQGLFIRQEFVTAGKLQLNQAIAQQDIQRAEWLLEVQRYRVLNDVRTQFYEILTTQMRAKLADDLLRTAENGVEFARELVEAGEAIRPDVLRAENEVERIRILSETTQNRFRKAWWQLAALLGKPNLPPIPLDGQLEDDIPKFTWDGIRTHVVGKSPEMKIAQTEVERARYKLQREQVEPVPNITVQAGVHYDTTNHDTIAGVQIGLPIPVFNRNQGGIQAAQADFARAQQELARVEFALQDRLAEAFEKYRNAQLKAHRYHTVIMPKEKRSLDLIIEGKGLHEFSFLQVLTAQQSYFETCIEYVDALTELWRSVVQLRGLLIMDGLRSPPGVLSDVY